MLAPKSSARVLSYITGWLTVLGWQACITAASYLTGTGIQGVVILTVPAYNPKMWHGTLITWALVACAFGINTFVSTVLAKIETIVLILHIVGFVALLIPLVYLAPHSSPRDVFSLFVNAGDWPTQTVSFFVGIIGIVFAFVGTDGAIHMSEEVKNAALVVPHSMIVSVLINGALGFAMVIAVLFCLGDIDKITSTPPTQYPFMAIFAQAAGSNSGGAGMIAVILFMFVCATTSVLASSSRMTWSFARDLGLPYSNYLSRVSLHLHGACSSIFSHQCIDQRTDLATSVCDLLYNSVHVSSKFDQYRFISRFQQRHLTDYQWTLLFLPHLLRTPPLAPLHWRYWWNKPRSSRQIGYAVGPFQNPRLIGHRNQCRGLCFHDRHYLFQFLATSHSNYCRVHELQRSRLRGCRPV